MKDLQLKFDKLLIDNNLKKREVYKEAGFYGYTYLNKNELKPCLYYTAIVMILRKKIKESDNLLKHIETLLT